MQTVTFFSFKGGVGRTYTMLNVAYEVARRGAFVVLADWDIHAPGLTVLPDLSPPEVEPGKLAVRKGVVDYFESALNFFENDEKGKVLDPSSFVCATQLANNAREENRFLEVREQFKGDIHFIPTGRFQPNPPSKSDNSKESIETGDAYHKQLQNIPFNLINKIKEDERKDRSLLKNFVHSIAKNVRSDVFGPEKPPDFLFIDCRTGLTELGDLTLDIISDHIVLVSGLNRQNLVGLDSTLDTIVPQVPFNGIRSYLSLVLSPVPFGEDELIKQSLRRVHKILDARLRHKEGGEREEKPEIFRIPYHPRVALAGGLLARDFPDAPPMQTYTQLATKLNQSKKDLDKTRELTKMEVQSITEETDEHLKTLVPSQEKGPVPHPIAVTPAWNWFQPELQAQEILPAETNPEKAEQVLTSLARSISIPKKDKLKILKNYGNLRVHLVSELLHALHEEHQQHLAITTGNYNYLASLIGKYLGSWLEIITEFYPYFVVGEELKKAAQNETNTSLGDIAQFAGFWVGLSDWSFDREEWLLCEFLLQRAVSIESTSSMAWNRLGNLYKDHLGKFESAEGAYKKAILHAQSKAHNAINFRNLGDLYTNQWSRYEEAEELYNKAIEYDPGYAAAFNSKGILYQNFLERYEEAEVAYRNAIASESERNAQAMFYGNLGNLYKDHFDKHEEAMAAFLRASELNPEDAVTYNSIGNLYQYQLGKNKEAEAAYQTALKLDPTGGFPANNWALLKLRLGNIDEAVRLSQLARSLAPQESIFLHVDGLVSLAQGKQEKGFSLIEQCAQAVEGKRHRELELIRELLMMAPFISEHQERLEELADTYKERFNIDESLLENYRAKAKASSES